jgi:hypothetical protein
MSDSGEYTNNELEDDGVLEPDEDLSTDDYRDDPLDTGIEPPDHYGASNWYGITEAEAKRGESLDQLLAEEEPDVGVTFEDDDEDEDDDLLEEDEAPPEDAGEGEIDDRWPDGPGPRSGRLVSDGRLTATDAGVDGGAAGAEEAAVHLEQNTEIRYRPKDGAS